MLSNSSITQFDHTTYGENLAERSFDGMSDLEECGVGDQHSVGEQQEASTPSLDQSGGRDSGISTESYKYQEFFTKVC